MTGGTETLGWWLSPWVLGLLGLCVGSFLNVVAHRLPRMMERQWWADVAAQLSDADSWQRTFGDAAPKPLAPTAQELERRLEALAPLSLARPASRCPSCGHAIRWHENIPAGLAAAARPLRRLRHAHLGALPAGGTGHRLLFAGLAWRWARSPRCCCGAAWRPPWWP
jgi:leader peptidase (prepilin peptidase)/N-methyltransferase